jgi:hypothetical protein
MTDEGTVGAPSCSFASSLFLAKPLQYTHSVYVEIGRDVLPRNVSSARTNLLAQAAALLWTKSNIIENQEKIV